MNVDFVASATDVRWSFITINFTTWLRQVQHTVKSPLLH